MARTFTPTPAQKRALDALATYQLLNADQLRRLGVARDIRDVRHALHGLEGCRWIDRTEAALVSGVTRLPALYWITAKGAERAAALGIPARGSDRELGTKTEIEHRMGIVEVHMALRTWAAGAGVAVDWVTVDFEAGSPGRHKATTFSVPTGGLFIPDMLAQVTPADREPRLVVVEVERGGAAESLSKFSRVKLPWLLHVSRSEVVENTFGVDRAARFLVVFQNTGMKRRALDKWMSPELDEWERFFVKGLDELAGDFNTGWAQPSGTAVNLF
jgi:hypothetical protein